MQQSDNRINNNLDSQLSLLSKCFILFPTITRCFAIKALLSLLVDYSIFTGYCLLTCAEVPTIILGDCVPLFFFSLYFLLIKDLHLLNTKNQYPLRC